MLDMRRGHVQSRNRAGAVHALPRGNILHYARRDGCDGLPRVCGQFKFPDSKLNRCGLHVQRGLLGPSRRPVRALRRRNLQTVDRIRRVHELSGLLRRGVRGVFQHIHLKICDRFPEFTFVLYKPLSKKEYAV